MQLASDSLTFLVTFQSQLHLLNLLVEFEKQEIKLDFRSKSDRH